MIQDPFASPSVSSGMISPLVSTATATIMTGNEIQVPQQPVPTEYTRSILQAQAHSVKHPESSTSAVAAAVPILSTSGVNTSTVNGRETTAAASAPAIDSVTTTTTMSFSNVANIAVAADDQVSDDTSKTSLASIRREYEKEWRQKRQQHFMENGLEIKAYMNRDEATSANTSTSTIGTLAAATTTTTLGSSGSVPTSPTTCMPSTNGKSAFSSVISRPNGSSTVAKPATSGQEQKTIVASGLAASHTKETSEITPRVVAQQQQQTQTTENVVKQESASEQVQVSSVLPDKGVHYAERGLETLILLDNSIYLSIGKLTNIEIEAGSWTSKTITIKVPNKYTHSPSVSSSVSATTLAPLTVANSSPSSSPMFAVDGPSQVDAKTATQQVSMMQNMTPLSPTFKSNPALLQRSSSANETNQTNHSDLRYTMNGLVSTSRSSTPVIVPPQPVSDTKVQNHQDVEDMTRQPDKTCAHLESDDETESCAGDGTSVEKSQKCYNGDEEVEEEENEETETDQEEEEEEADDGGDEGDDDDDEHDQEKPDGQNTRVTDTRRDEIKTRPTEASALATAPTLSFTSPSTHPLHKTVVCRYFARGNCEKSDSECSFIHGTIATAKKNAVPEKNAPAKKNAVTIKQQAQTWSDKTSIVVVNKAVQQKQQQQQQQQQYNKPSVKHPTSDKKSVKPEAVDDYQDPFWCDECAMGFQTFAQRKQHEAGDMHKYFTELNRLNVYTSRISLSNSSACFNCGKRDHILVKCPVGFCRRNGNGDCTYGSSCALKHISYDIFAS